MSYITDMMHPVGLAYRNASESQKQDNLSDAARPISDLRILPLAGGHSPSVSELNLLDGLDTYLGCPGTLVLSHPYYFLSATP